MNRVILKTSSLITIFLFLLASCKTIKQNNKPKHSYDNVKTFEPHRA